MDVKKRLCYVDYLKAIGIFLVVLGHQPLTNITFHNWIYSFHVPLFFFVSGFLMKVGEDHFKHVLWKNLRTLILVMVPYFTINRFYSLFEYALFYPEKFNTNDILYEPMANSLLGTSQMGSMWFLYALFWMRIVYWLIYRYICKQKIIICLLSLIVGYALCNYNGVITNYYQIGAAIIAFPFFCMGCITRFANECYLFFERPGGGKIRACIGLVLLLGAFVLLFYLGDVNLNALITGNSAALYYIVAITNIFGFLLITSVFCRCRVVENISNSTLLILGLHGILVQLFKMGYKTLLGITQHPPYMDSLSGILISILIIVILYPLIAFMLRSNKKTLLFLLGK